MISANKSLGFVILNYNTWEKTILCVKSIFNTYLGKKNIVIVDNQSPNESYDKLTKYYNVEGFEDVEIVQSGKNGGFSYGNNFGFNYINEKYPDIDKIIITNNDIIFQSEAIDRLISGFNHTDDVVMTAPKIYDTEGNKTNIPWKCKPNVMQELYLADCSLCIYKWEELNDNVFAYMVSGCCFAVDRFLFSKIGGFDEKVFLYNEENIISKKIADHHLKIIYCSGASVIHDHGSSTGTQSIFVDKEYAKSALYFFKNYERLPHVSLILIKSFLLSRIIAKYVLQKYKDRDGFWKGVKEIVSC